MDPDWLNVCWSLPSAPGTEEQTADDLVLEGKYDKPAPESINYMKKDKYTLFWLQFVLTMVLESHKTDVSYCCCLVPHIHCPITKMQSIRFYFQQHNNPICFWHRELTTQVKDGAQIHLNMLLFYLTI